MHASLDYAWEQLYGAVSSLADGKAACRSGVNAYVSRLHWLRPDDFPTDLRPDFVAPIEPIGRVMPAGEEMIAAERVTKPIRPGGGRSSGSDTYET